MKLVDFKEFIRMPAGTIFAPYTPCILQDRLAVKVDTGRDSRYGYVFCGVMPLEPWLGDYNTLLMAGDKDKISFEIYDGDNNDYRDYKLFLIFEKGDIDRFIRVLEWAKGGCVGDCDCVD